MCVCRRGRYGEGWGSGMDETSWVWSGYQWGLSSSKAVSNCIRICSNQKPQQELSILLTSTSDLGGLHEKSSFFDISERKYSDTGKMRVMLRGKGAQTFKYVTDLDWDNVTTWTDWFFWPKSLSGKHKQTVYAAVTWQRSSAFMWIHHIPHNWQPDSKNISRTCQIHQVNFKFFNFNRHKLNIYHFHQSHKCRV